MLPIGDSITWGAQSSDENGYRRVLHDNLVSRGNNVDFVGSLANGDFADDQHEGWRGKVIDEIRAYSGRGIYAAPNIVLLHAGTNDMLHDLDTPNAPKRLKKLVDLIFQVNPDAAVFLCQIIPSTTASIQQRIEIFNAAIPGVVADYVKAGKKVTMVEMNKAVYYTDLKDNLHPNDGGYRKMAAAWYAAINEADGNGWISKAGKARDPPDSTSPDACQATPSWYHVGQIADGAKVYVAITHLRRLVRSLVSFTNACTN